MTTLSSLKTAFPWIKFPLTVSAPMLGAATPAFALSVSRAGGIGFLAGGTNLTDLDRNLEKTASLFNLSPSPRSKDANLLPVGIGFQNWGCDLSAALELTKKHMPSIVWFYAPNKIEDLRTWAREFRAATGNKIQIWVQVGTVKDAVDVMHFAKPDVLVLQGADAGGHGLARSASIISLLPEAADALEASGVQDVPLLAAGGVTEERGVAAAVALGAVGAVVGTRFLAANTGRSTLCDRLKGTVGWPPQYDGRALLNKGHEDMEAGMTDDENARLYKEELKRGDEAWGAHGRMVAYAGTGVGLIQNTIPAKEIVNELTIGAMDILCRRVEDLSERGNAECT
ncbi:hypothetical protein B7463_g12698, partial [Scytalidium lignicola]